MDVNGSTCVPVQVDLYSLEKCLEITWDDNHISRYPYWYVRGYCPCAHCQGHGGPIRFVEADMHPDVSDISEVGNYALTIAFKGGHRTGIYTFSYLRTMCPCAACREHLGDAHAVLGLPEHVRGLL